MIRSPPVRQLSVPGLVGLTPELFDSHDMIINEHPQLTPGCDLRDVQFRKKR